MTPPSTSNDENNDKIFQQKQKKLSLVVVGIVVPILFTIAILMSFGIFEQEEKLEFERLYTFPDKLLVPNEVTIPTNLFNLGMTLDNEISLVEDIFSKVNLRCINVNWYGEEYSKRQIFYNDSVFEIQVVLKELEIDVNGGDAFIQFINNPLTQMFVEVNCPHVENMLQIPNQYDVDFKGKTAYNACNTHPFFLNKIYCNYLPKEPLTT